jgi:molecular chaperone HscB
MYPHALCMRWGRFLNHFELFGLPQQFAVDTVVLGQRYRELQQQHHPDQHGVDQAEALRLSTLINQAYDTLRLADRRAAYLLGLHRQDGALSQSIGDLDFLQSALELREQLEEAHTPLALSSLRLEIHQWIDALSREFQIDLNDQDWIEARDTARKLAFMQRVLADVDRAEDRLEDLEEEIFHDDF